MNDDFEQETGPGRFRGADWPDGGGDPFDGRLPYAGLFYWAHEKPSRVFPAEQTPDDTALYAAIPMGYTTLALLERVALVTGGRCRRRWKAGGSRAVATPLQQFQLLLPPTGPDGGYLLLGATWPERFAVRDAERLSARTGGRVLVCRPLEHHNWH
ncbi:hypothetical protein [Catellatospora sp. NPDC049609]|uniref:hypothetical protein n=1 Tax=Catellatospora sp. NPDC049609 TaxID=3155505 RepID=UPI0034208D5C